MFRLNVRRIFFLLILLLFVSETVHAQGLKGARMPEKILGRLTYIKGNSDQERWKTFLTVQPKLIGMSFADVQKVLGEELISDKELTEIEYGLTQEVVRIGKKESCLHVKVFFLNGFVCKYSVEASQ